MKHKHTPVSIKTRIIKLGKCKKIDKGLTLPYTLYQLGGAFCVNIRIPWW